MRRYVVLRKQKEQIEEVQIGLAIMNPANFEMPDTESHSSLLSRARAVTALRKNDISKKEARNRIDCLSNTIIELVEPEPIEERISGIRMLGNWVSLCFEKVGSKANRELELVSDEFEKLNGFQLEQSPAHVNLGYIDTQIEDAEEKIIKQATELTWEHIESPTIVLGPPTTDIHK